MVRARKRPPDGRVNSGGSREGTPGQSYGNRSDLRAQKVSVPPSAEYGQGERLRRSQQAVPMAGAPPVPTATPAGGAPASQGPMPPPPPGDFTRPTERPGEPLTTGIPSGPGGGPEVLSASRRPDPELEALRAYLPTLELLASQPNASPSAQMFVRRLRGMMPPAGG